MDTPVPKRPCLVPAPAPRTIADMAPAILLRLPPDDPARLVRASLVCWRWRRLLTDPAYFRRYREFHRTPPMLGFVLNLKQHFQGMAQLVPTSSFRPAASDRPGLNVLDARHGRVLLHTAQGQSLVVWDPVTGGECKITRVPAYALGFNAAVLCAVVGCDHLDCHGGPFRVAFVGCGERGITFACTYSSEAGAWSQRIEIEQPASVDGRPSVLNGTLYLWSMKDGPDGDVEWVQRRVIHHKTMLRTRGLSTPPEVVGFADGHGLIFVRTGNTVFSMELKSGHVRKVYTCRSRNYDVIVVPYMSFCTPERAMGRLPSP